MMLKDIEGDAGRAPEDGGGMGPRRVSGVARLFLAVGGEAMVPTGRSWFPAVNGCCYCGETSNVVVVRSLAS